MKKLLPLLLAAAPLTVSAQAQRTVLLEHFTQASCGPCAFYNPTIHNNLVAVGDDVVVIKYHTSWPGTDPMYDDNPSEVDTRVSFYNVTSVPNSAIDGEHPTGAGGPGHPANWNADTLANHYVIESPYTMRLNHRYILTTGGANDSIETRVVVNKVGDVGTAVQKLYVAITEQEVDWTSPPGTNGEKNFPYVFKKMMPSISGESMPTLAVGDSIVYMYKWKLGHIYSKPQLAVVAFVQDNSTKHVHQAITSRPYSPAPVLMANVPPTVITGAAGGSYDFTADITTTSTSPMPFTVYGPTTQVAGTVVTLLDGSGNEVNSIDISISASTPASIPVRLTVTNGANLHGNVNLKVVPADPLYSDFSVSKPIQFFSQANILIINKDNAGASSLTAATSGRGAYSINPTEYSLAPANLVSIRNYSKILIGTGTAYADLMSLEMVDSLRQFMDDGGDVAFMGNELGYFTFADTVGHATLRNIYHNYLGADFLADGPGTQGADGSVTVVPVAGDTVAYGLTANVNMSSGSYDQLGLYDNGVTDPVGVECFDYTNGAVAGIRTHVGNRHTVYFSFPFNLYSPASARIKLMKNIIDYFDDAFVTAANGKVNLMPMIMAPNPTTGTTTFRNLEAGDQIRVMDVMGRVVAEGKATMNELTLNLNNQAAGIYNVTHIRQNAVVATQQLSVTR